MRESAKTAAFVSLLGLGLAGVIAGALLWRHHPDRQARNAATDRGATTSELAAAPAPPEPQPPPTPAESAVPSLSPAERDAFLKAYLETAARNLAEKYIESATDIQLITLRKVTDARQRGLDIGWMDVVDCMNRFSWRHAPPQSYAEFVETFISLRTKGESGTEAESIMKLILSGLDEEWAPRSVSKDVSIMALWREFRDNQVSAGETWFWQIVQFEQRIRTIDRALDGTILVQFGNTLQAHVTCYVPVEQRENVLPLKRRAKTHVKARVLGYNQF